MPDDLPANFGRGAVTGEEEGEGEGDLFSAMYPREGSSPPPNRRDRYVAFGEVMDDSIVTQQLPDPWMGEEQVRREEIEPSNHPQTEMMRNADGSPRLTNNESLNRMLMQSFQGFLQQYASQGERLHSLRGSSSTVQEKSAEEASPHATSSMGMMMMKGEKKADKGRDSPAGAIDYDSYKRLMDSTIQKTNELIQKNTKDLKALATAVEGEERQRQQLLQSTSSSSPTAKPRTASSSLDFSHPSNAHSRLSLDNNSSWQQLLRRAQLPSNKSANNKEKPSNGRYSEQVLPRSRKGAVDSDEEQSELPKDAAKSRMRKKKSKESAVSSTTSPLRGTRSASSSHRRTISSAHRSNDFERADLRTSRQSFPYSMASSLPLSTSEGVLSKQSKAEYEKLMQKMMVASQLQSRNSSIEDTFSSNRKSGRSLHKKK